jgi:glutamate 5-kinase
LIHTVTQLNSEVLAYVQDRMTGISKGGMASKLQAARMAAAAGENVIIASGRRSGVLKQIMDGQQVGTLVLAQGKSISPRKRWIGFSARSCGKLVVDSGARQAIVKQGRSLLAIGILHTDGSFRKGDLVTVCDEAGREIGRGLTNYHAEEVGRIKGLRSDRIAQVLGHCPYDEVIHRDNMTVLDG